MALYEALVDIGLFPQATQTYGLCALGLPQVKAAGLVLVFDQLCVPMLACSQ